MIRKMSRQRAYDLFFEPFSVFLSLFLNRLKGSWVTPKSPQTL
jgi:hypothetical protein